MNQNEQKFGHCSKTFQNNSWNITIQYDQWLTTYKYETTR
jgi:hypothetical protein